MPCREFNHAMQLFLYQIAVAGTSGHATDWELMVWVTGPAAIIAAGADAGRLTYMTTLPGRAGQHADWPGWVPAELVSALEGIGVTAPWLHQAETANLVQSGQSAIIS